MATVSSITAPTPLTELPSSYTSPMTPKSPAAMARGLGLVLAVFSLETLGLFISRFTRSILLCLYTAYGCAAKSPAANKLTFRL